MTSIYKTLFFRMLKQLPKGCLKMQLPDGTIHFFGDRNSAFQAEIIVANDDFFRRCFLYADVGFGESYVAADWDSPDVEKVLCWFILNIQRTSVLSGGSKTAPRLNFLGISNKIRHWLRPNSRRGSRKNIYEHYDLGNAFFELFLDPSMTYSSAYFTHPDQTLQQAQMAKYDALCQKLHIQSSDHVLEIGCGWGGFAVYAAQHFGCRVTGITISRQQYDWCVKRVAQAGLSDKIKILLVDYRDMQGQFDKIVSIEMLEAIGDRYIELFCAQCQGLLKPGGLLGLQFITVPDARYAVLRDNVDWIQKHIFPGSLLFSIGRLNHAFNQTSAFSLHDLEDMGHFYVKTLACWLENFDRQLTAIAALGYPAAFIRLWRYYLIYCKAGFRMHNISVVQAVYTRPNNPLCIRKSGLELSAF